jgi:hypothetical protein
MAIVDRNVLRLAVYEFIYQDTPGTVAINEALEIARRFSTFEATQFINGILDAIKQDLEAVEAMPALIPRSLRRLPFSLNAFAFFCFPPCASLPRTCRARSADIRSTKPK